jgi:hypothetical protein
MRHRGGGRGETCFEPWLATWQQLATGWRQLATDWQQTGNLATWQPLTGNHWQRVVASPGAPVLATAGNNWQHTGDAEFLRRRP